MKCNETSARMNEMEKICSQTENTQTDRQTIKQFENWGHSTPLWIVGGAGQLYLFGIIQQEREGGARSAPNFSYLKLFRKTDTYIFK